MSGHSKWSTIKRKKGIADAQKGKLFTRLGRALAVAVKEGGSSDLDSNSKLRDVVTKARAIDMPMISIQRAIRRAAGDDGDNYLKIIYEGYGPGGVAIVVETLTDNRNRTAGDMRHYFDKFGGNLGQSGSVMYMFDQRGVIIIEKGHLDEDKLVADAIEFGVFDFSEEEEYFQIITKLEDYVKVSDEMRKRCYTIISSQLEYLPNTWVKLDDEEHIKNLNLIFEHLDDNSDVQNIFHNWSED